MNVYLPIRNLGDFMITASVVKNNAVKKVPIILPRYLNDIFAAVEGERYFEVIGRIDYETQPAFFEFYKVKDLNNVKRLLKDLQTIYNFTSKNDTSFLLDYRSRRLFFTRSRFMWPSVEENIYEGKLALLSQDNLLKTKAGKTDLIEPVDKRTKVKVLILPDSRIASKKIDDELVTKVKQAFSNIQPQVAHFSKNALTETTALQYKNFEELIALIMSYDLIISAESLPYHLANYLNKPHFVIYNKSRHYKSNFMTPFMLRNNYYASYDGNNSDEVLEILRGILPYNV